jgi:hypothetical protein
MRELKEVVLVQKPQGLLEVVSFFDSVTRTFGIYIYFRNKLIEIIQPLLREPKRYQMRNPWRYSLRYPWKFDLNGKITEKKTK